MYFVPFWVIPRRLSSNCRRFGTHYRFHLHRQVNEIWPAYEDGTDSEFRNVGNSNSDAGELPKKEQVTFRTRRKLKNKGFDLSFFLSTWTFQDDFSPFKNHTTNSLPISKRIKPLPTVHAHRLALYMNIIVIYPEENRKYVQWGNTVLMLNVVVHIVANELKRVDVKRYRMTLIANDCLRGV